MATADRQLFDYFYKIRMNGGKRNGNNTLYLDNHTAITCTFYFQEDAFLTFEVTTRDTNFRALGQIQFIGLEIQEVVIIGTRYSDETLHLTVGDDYLPSAAGIGDVLQVTDLRLHTFYIRRTGICLLYTSDAADEL